MAGFLGKLKSGADKAAFEADRLVRVNQAQAAVRAVQRELEAEVEALGKQVLDLYDAGALSQPELLAAMPKIDSLRERIVAQEAEVERIRQEKPPEAAAPDKPAAPPTPAPPPRAPAPTPAPPPHAAPPMPSAPTAPQARVCPQCQTPLKPDVRFCPECGFRVLDI